MKTVSVIALVFGIITFFFGLMSLTWAPSYLWHAVTPYAVDEFDLIAGCLAIPYVLSFIFFMSYFLLIPATGLVLSVVTLFIEPNKRRRLLPLLFTLLGLYLFFASLALQFIWLPMEEFF